MGRHDPGQRPPRYGTHTLADVLPAVVSVLRPDDGKTPRPIPGSGIGADLADIRERVVVLVMDGLGANILDLHAHAAPTLTSSPGDDVEAVFPTTTVSSLASIGTGQPPGVHGLVGYSWPLPDHKHPLNALGWRIGHRGGGFDARSVVVPEQLQPQATALERAAASGITTAVVLDPDHLDSGLTRAGLRGGQRIGARSLVATLRRAVDEATASDGPAMVYAHHPLVDRAGHEYGTTSTETRDAVGDVDRALTALLADLPRDVTVLVTADHGMIDVPDAQVIELADHPALFDGVRVLAGEPRVRHLALDEAVDVAAVAEQWRSTLGDRALVLTRDEAMHLFAPEPSSRARAAVGDLIVLATDGSLVHERVDPNGGRHRGQHGGLTDAERLVPLRRLEAGR